MVEQHLHCEPSVCWRLRVISPAPGRAPLRTCSGLVHTIKVGESADTVAKSRQGCGPVVAVDGVGTVCLGIHPDGGNDDVGVALLGTDDVLRDCVGDPGRDAGLGRTQVSFW